MRVDGIRILADWCAGPEYGVNALLPLVPQDVGDFEVPLITIVDETRHGWVARKKATQKIAESGPYLAISMFDQLDFDGLDQLESKTWQEAQISFAIRYISKEVDSELGNVFAGRTLQAARWSITLLNMALNESSRTRNGVRLEECVSLHELDVNAPFGDAVVTGGMVARYNAIAVIPVPQP